MSQESFTNHWISVLERQDNWWLHDGNPKRPHAVLAFGNHSNGFANCSELCADPRLLADATSHLITLTHRTLGGFSPRFDRIVGSAHGATYLSFEMARHLGVPAGFTEETRGGDGAKTMVQKRFNIAPGTVVGVVEDVITTFGTTRMTIAALEQGGAVVLPFVLAIVNRSGQTEHDGRRVIALIEKPMPTWTPEDCLAEHLCSVGSEALRPPKARENWARLHAEYPS